MTLADYLKAHHITQAEFGRKLDPPVSQGKVNHWLQGTRRVSLAEALQIVELTEGEVDMRSLAALSVSRSIQKTADGAPVAAGNVAVVEGAHV